MRLRSQLAEAKAQVSHLNKARFSFSALLDEYLSDPDEKQRASHSRYYLGVTDFNSFYDVVFPYIGSIKVKSVGVRDALKWTLLWARRGLTWQGLALHSGIKKTTIRKVVKGVTSYLRAWADTMISFPSLDEWLASMPVEMLTSKELKGFLYFFVDGTVIEKADPFDHRVHRFLFNVKHNITAYSYFILVQPNGRITYVSMLRGGSETDKAQWNSSDVIERIKEAYPDSHFEHLGEDGSMDQVYSFAIGGDKGYPGMDLPADWHAFITKTGLAVARAEAAKGELPLDFEKTGRNGFEHYLPEIAPYRAVVERSFGAMKKWLALLNVPLMSKMGADEVEGLIVVVAALCNYQLEIRDKSW